jgi:folate-dependent phosphoribosylglycinamide formyltransferase PurN
VHFVDTRYDEGAIIAQRPVPVQADDTPATLAARVLAAEHQLYPRIVAALCAGRITLAADGTVRGAEEFTSEQAIPGAPPVP